MFFEHPNLNQYRDGGIGGDERANVVGMVPTHLLERMPGNSTQQERVEHYRQALRSGEGFTDPIMVEFDPKTRLAMVGEGNHRLRAAVQEGASHVPARVVRSRIESLDNWDDGGRPKPVYPGTSPWKGGMGEEYWPSDIHPKYLWPGEDVR
jgi:hypothetical protein